MKGAGFTILVAGILCFATAGFAQSRGMGRVCGVVVDQKGSPVAEVAIKTATLSGAVIEATTDPSGKWTLAGIGRGEWVVSFVKPGFATKRIRAIVERELDRSEPIKITMTKS